MPIGNKKLRKEKGSALLYALVILSAGAIIMVSSVQYITAQIKYSFYQKASEEALRIAEAGGQFYGWYLTKNTVGKSWEEIYAFLTEETLLGRATGGTEIAYKNLENEIIGSYILQVDKMPAKGSTVIEVSVIGKVKESPLVERKLKFQYRLPTWCEYAVLTNEQAVYDAQTQIYGRIFSNEGVHFDGVAHGGILSAKETYHDTETDMEKPGVWTSWVNEYNSDLASQVFLAGKKYPSLPKDFSDIDENLSLLKTVAENESTYFDNAGAGRYLVLRGDKFDIRQVVSRDANNEPIFAEENAWSLDNDLPDEGVIFVENNLWVEGELGETNSGRRLTVVAANLAAGEKANVFIGEDIIYGDSSQEGNTALGIIAQKDIEIIKDSPDSLRIDGALLAVEGQIGREDYSRECECDAEACEDHKDTITFWGSLISQKPYKFSQTDSCHGETGYATEIIYFDNKLTHNPPPYFPGEKQYRLDFWGEI
jgi:hypothetical protein